MRPSREGSIRLLVLVLFFLSGACGLAYEVVWMRMLTLVFGATAFATSAILASFFAGLALGSFHFGRVVDRGGRNPLVLYALLEAGIGLAALVMPVVLAGLTAVFVAVSRGLAPGFYAMSLLRLGLSFLVLLVPTTLMGGTLPVIVKFFTTRKDRVGWSVGRLYAVNTFGAVAGALAAGFFLILLLGLKETTYVAAAANLLIAGVVLLLARAGAGVPATEEAPAGVEAAASATTTAEGAAAPEPGVEPAATEVPVGRDADALSPGRARLALWAVGVSGLCALALEVLWTRALVFFLDNSTHAFTTMLTAFLLGIALGSAVVARFADRWKRQLAWFGTIEVLIGLSAVAAIPILGSSTPVLERMVDASADSMLPWRWIGTRFVVSLSVMLVPTVLMGMTVPLVCRIYTRRLATVGTALGRVYSVNTIGGVLGSVLAGFVLIPLMGVHNGIVAVAAASIVLGGALVLADPWTANGRVARALVAAGVAALTVGTLALGGGAMVLTSYREKLDAAAVLSYEEGVGSTVKVFEDRQGDKIISIDGFPVAGTSFGMRDAQTVLGNLPLLLSEVPGARVNLIGFGAGGASWAALQYDVSAVDCVELVPSVIRAARWFPEVNHNVLDQPRYRVILDDGRNHALVTDKTYDVISIDATSPKMAGNGSLYTVEFYELLRNMLSEKGVAVQWLPFHLLSDAEMRMTAKSFLAVFPHTTVWLSPIRHHAVLVGTPERLAIDVASMGRKMQRPAVRRELERLNVTDPMDVLGWFVMGEEALGRYVEGARMNTDDHPYLEFTPAMAYFFTMGYASRNLLNFARSRESVFPLLVNTGDTDEEVAALSERVERRYQAMRHTLSGDILLHLGQTERAMGEYKRAVLLDPDEKNWAHPAWSSYLPPR